MPKHQKTATNTYSHSNPELTAEHAKRVFQDGFIREVRINYERTEQPVLKLFGTSDVARFVRSVLTDNSRQHLVALFVDEARQINAYAVTSIGTANQAVYHPREIFQRAIAAGAVGVVLAHNDPTNDVFPNASERILTKRCRDAGDTVGIPLLDHLIVTDTDYYSFYEREGEGWPTRIA